MRVHTLHSNSTLACRPSSRAIKLAYGVMFHSNVNITGINQSNLIILHVLQSDLKHSTLNTQDTSKNYFAYCDLPVFDKASDDTESIMNGAISLLQHQLVGASHHDGYSLTRVSNTCDLQSTHNILYHLTEITHA